jgi:hypothetical protein
MCFGFTFFVYSMFVFSFSVHLLLRALSLSVCVCMCKDFQRIALLTTTTEKYINNHVVRGDLEMNHPKLLPSQELVLHQVSVDSFSPATASALKFPTSPLLPRSPFSPVVAVTAASSPSLPTSLTPSADIAASSIVRPQIRPREEWETSLAHVEAYELSSHYLHTSSVDRTEAVAVRYIADRYDRAWLSRWPVLALRGEDGVVSVLRGKTGGVGSHVPVDSKLSVSALEDVFTALELAAYHHPEVPLERLLPYAKAQLEECTLRGEAVDELHSYWLLRRHGTGGLLPTIPNLRSPIREDNEMALCHPAVLRDCPLPFKQRDWYVPVVQRCRPAALPGGTAAKRPRDETMSDSILEQLNTCSDYVTKALRLSRAMLQREEYRLAHTHLTMYELAYLRRVADTENASSSSTNGNTPVLEHALSQFIATSCGSGSGDDTIE